MEVQPGSLRPLEGPAEVLPAQIVQPQVRCRTTICIATNRSQLEFSTASSVENADCTGMWQGLPTLPESPSMASIAAADMIYCEHRLTTAHCPGLTRMNDVNELCGSRQTLWVTEEVGHE